MIIIENKEKCCGCSACEKICPVKCIEMYSDEEGFLYPKITASNCVNCHKCEKVCPIYNYHINSAPPNAYLARTKDNDLLNKCTSGGVFTTLAKDVISLGGVAYGAAYNDDFSINHVRIDDASNIYTLSGSKYVQSNMGDSFNLIKKDLVHGFRVIVCGTPCQIVGLKNFLGKDYSNLILVDLVCHGVPSPKLWKEYTTYIQKKNGKLTEVNFRSKKLGYHVSVMEEKYENGKTKFGSARTNLMSKCFFMNVADRPICYDCPFKTVSRCSDLTLFDGWHAKKYVSGLKDDDKGYTIVLSHSDKGENLLKKNYALMDVYSINLELAIETDGGMAYKSIVRPKNRENFYFLLNKYGLYETVNRLFPVKKTDYLIEYIKLITKKMGILNVIKKLKG